MTQRFKLGHQPRRTAAVWPNWFTPLQAIAAPVGRISIATALLLASFSSIHCPPAIAQNRSARNSLGPNLASYSSRASGGKANAPIAGSVARPASQAMGNKAVVKRPGSSSRQDRLASVSAIPFNELNDAAQQRIRQVVTNPSFYRRLPVGVIDADPDHFRFLIRKPEVVVSIWQLMGVTQLTAKRTGPYSIESNDGAGTLSDLELVYGNNDLHVFYGTGSYAGPVLRRKLSGRCVIVIQTRSIPKREGGFELTSQLDVFIKVDNATAALVARTIQPIVGSTADHNFVESLKFIQKLNETARGNGPGVQAMASRLELDKSTQVAYQEVVEQVFERAYQTMLAKSTAAASDRFDGRFDRSTRNGVGRVAVRGQSADATPGQSVGNAHQAAAVSMGDAAAPGAGVSLYQPNSRSYQYFGGRSRGESSRGSQRSATAEQRKPQRLPEPARATPATGYPRQPAVRSTPNVVRRKEQTRASRAASDASSQAADLPRQVAGVIDPAKQLATQDSTKSNVVGVGEGFSVLEGGPWPSRRDPSPSQTVQASAAVHETFSSPAVGRPATARFSDAGVGPLPAQRNSIKR